MDSKEYIDQKIWDYLDGCLDKIEVKQIEQKISSEDAWKNAFETLSLIHNDLQGLSLDEPSHNFSAKVMERVGRQGKKKEMNLVVVSIALFFALCIAFIALRSAFSNGTDNSSAVFSYNGFNFPDTGVKEHLYYTLLGVNVILSLIFLDKLLTRSIPKAK